MARTRIGVAIASLALLAALGASPLAAQTNPPQQAPEKPPSEMAREAIEQLMRALTRAIQNLPQYALPELNERGDIIIRRLNPPRAEEPRRPPSSPDETRT